MKSRPVHEVRIGRVKASVWQRPKLHRVAYTVTFARTGSNGTARKPSRLFRPEDLFSLMKTADLALGWINAQPLVPTISMLRRD